MNAIELIRKDHHRATQVLEHLRGISSHNPTMRLETFVQLRQVLTAHADAVETQLYPRLADDPATSEIVQRLRAHVSAMRYLLNELDALPVDSVGFAPRLEDLQGVMQEHDRLEEGELLPLLAESFSDTELTAIGAVMEAVRDNAVGQPTLEPPPPEQVGVPDRDEGRF